MNKHCQQDITLPISAHLMSAEDLAEVKGARARGRREKDRAQHIPSPDFADNPAACDRFIEWFNTSPLTVGRGGRHTISALAKTLVIHSDTASSYLKDPSKITRLAALRLEAAIMKETRDSGGTIEDGRRAYYELIHGPGTYSARIREQEKQRNIGAIVSRFDKVVSALRKDDFSTVNDAVLLVGTALDKIERDLSAE
ncbi:hypothetical protein [Thermophilibacter sp.]